VIRLFISKLAAAHFTAVPARLYVPLGNQATREYRVMQ
jgi:hypothetical protein